MSEIILNRDKSFTFEVELDETKCEDLITKIINEEVKLRLDNQEIRLMNDLLKYQDKINDKQLAKIKYLKQENAQLKERVDKVLKLANTILDLPEDKFCKYDTYLNSINEILEILKGEDK